MSIRNNDTLVFKTYTQDTIDPDSRKYIKGKVSGSIKSIGHIQPYTSHPKMQVETPQGFSLDGAYWWATKDVIPIIDDISASQPATTVIDCRTYFAYKCFDFARRSKISIARNYYVLVLDKSVETSV